MPSDFPQATILSRGSAPLYRARRQCPDVGRTRTLPNPGFKVYVGKQGHRTSRLQHRPVKDKYCLLQQTKLYLLHEQQGLSHGILSG